ncbi:glycosyltransferase family 2 protein, partial [Gordonia rhizosphera]
MSSVDVAIPSYQYGSYLRDAAMSVLSQDGADLRLLIVDNASTDGSQEIAREIAAADDRVTLFLNDENRGMFDSYNRAIDWADADYCVILDADDVLASGSLATSIEFLDDHPDVAFAYGVEGRLTDGRLDPGRCDSRTTRWRVVSGNDYIRRT